METSKQRLRRAMRLPGPSIGLKRSQTDTTNGQAQLRPGYQAEGGVQSAAASLPHLQLIPPSSKSRDGHQPTTPPNSSGFSDRWTEIRQKAELRRTGQGAYQSDEETLVEESIESQVARIKARVAELTNSVESGIPGSAERNQESPLTLHARRHTAGNITTSPNVQSAPRHNDIYMEPVVFDDALSEPSGIKTVEDSTRTSSADGTDLTCIERDPFCRPWDSKSILNRILSEMGVPSARDALKRLGVTDLWLPLSKQLLKRSLSDPRHVSEFMGLQEEHLSVVLARWTQSATREHIHDMMLNHCEFEDDEEIFEDNRVLGEGLVGLVEEVTVRSREPAIICVRKKIMRPKQLKAHQKIMAAFIREIGVMRQVDHRHCVRFLGSYTDNESVNILSTPVADMDLATFLDKPIRDREWAILYKGIDCLCNGLLYLHENKIRHEDLKPQNVLVHGHNILLTDFGFSLDFSDDSVSTTTGRPSAWTIRYSAPEVLDSEPRNRASDIFSLGCVLIEMASGLYGHSLSEVKDYWKKTSNGQSSFARNPQATSSWIHLLSDRPAVGRLDQIIDFLPALLVTKRLDRPSAQTVVHSLKGLSLRFPDPPRLFNTCCGPPAGRIKSRHPNWGGGTGLLRARDPQFWSDLRSYFDAVADPEMSYVILDQRFKQVAAKHNCYSRLWNMLNDVSPITAACETLFLKSDKTEQISIWTHHPSVVLAQLRNQDLDQVLPQVLEAYTSWQVIFTALSTNLPTPKSQWLPKAQVPFQLNGLLTACCERTVQISMVGNGRCPTNDRCFGSVYYVLAFKLFEKGYEPSELGAPIVDMSRTTPERLEMDDDWGIDFAKM